MASGDFAKAIQDGMMNAIRSGLQKKFGAIRHPVTGEFPTVVVEGRTLDDMQVRIEGTPELLALIRERLGENELEGVQMAENSGTGDVKAFLSYAGSDRALAETIAHQLQSNGINTWWAEWEIGPGDSIRQKIDNGLGDCTHFLVLLTPNSIDRPWVKAEMDAGFVRMMDDRCKFIPLRHHLAAQDLPPLLQGRLAPEVDDTASNLAELVNFIHGVGKKPPLGPKPAATAAVNTGYSPAASTIAEVFVRDSRNGLFMDPQFTVDKLQARTGLTRNDVVDGLHELRHYFRLSREDAWPENSFFVEFDQHFMGWNAADDALRLAADIVNDPAFPAAPKEIAERYGWHARRLNPVITFLNDRKLAQVLSGIGGAPYLAFSIKGTDGTRRFVKSRS